LSTPETSLADFIALLEVLDYAGTFNAVFNPTCSHPDVPAGEKAVFEKITPNGHRFVFTPGGFTFPGHGFIPYQDVFRADWGAFDPHDQSEAYQNYLSIYFHDQPPINIFVGASGESVKVGGLITMMKTFKLKPGELI
jgi:hypothetical protein